MTSEEKDFSKTSGEDKPTLVGDLASVSPSIFSKRDVSWYKNLPLEISDTLTFNDLSMEALGRNYLYDLGKVLVRTRDAIKSYQREFGRQHGVFFKNWYESWGLKKTQVYTAINTYTFFKQLESVHSEEEVQEIYDRFSSMTKKTQEFLTRPTLSPEMRKIILEKNPKTNAELQKLIKSEHQHKKKIENLEKKISDLEEDKSDLQEKTLDALSKASEKDKKIAEIEQRLQNTEVELLELQERASDPELIEVEPEDYQSLKLEKRELEDRIKDLEKEKVVEVYPKDYESAKEKLRKLNKKFLRLKELLKNLD